MNTCSKREASPRRWLARGCDPRPAHAFTLLEILVVLAIIALLAGLAIMNLGGAHANAEKAAARLMVTRSMKTALNVYRMSMGDYPSTADGLQALVTRPITGADRWSGPYIDGAVPLDPWGEPYQYSNPGTHSKDGYDLWSKGRDRRSGTEDDITNWDVKVPANPE